MLTFENNIYTARKFKFSIENGDLESTCVSEKVLVAPADIDLQKFELRDFRVSDKSSQYQVLYRLKDGYNS